MRRMLFNPVLLLVLAVGAMVLLFAMPYGDGRVGDLTVGEAVSVLYAQETVVEVPTAVPTVPKSEPLPKADVTVEGPQRVVPGRLAAFTLKGLPSQYVAAFDWVVFNSPDDAVILDMADRRSGAPVLIFQTDTPGRYVIIADVNVEPLSDCKLLVHEFTVGEVGPSPPPPPPPPPPAKELFGVVVEESSDRLQERDGEKVNFGLVIRSERVSELFKTGRFIVVDKDGEQVPDDWGPYLDRAVKDKRQLPWLYLVNEKGEVLYDGPLPHEVSDAVDKIKEFAP